MSKMLFCNNEYLCGVSIDQTGLIVRSLLADFTVFQLPGLAKTVKIHNENIYIIANTNLKVYELSNSDTAIADVSIGKVGAEDLLVTDESVYVILNDMVLLGVKRRDLEHSPSIKISVDISKKNSTGQPRE
jgi:hypothetical protein